jgi:hypothetical protein
MNTDIILFFFLSLNGIYCETGSKHGMSKLGVLDVYVFADLPNFYENTILSKLGVHSFVVSGKPNLDLLFNVVFFFFFFFFFFLYVTMYLRLSKRENSVHVSHGM